MPDDNMKSKYGTGDGARDELLEQILREAGYVHEPAPAEAPPAGRTGSLSGDSGRLKSDTGHLKQNTGRLSSNTGRLRSDTGRLKQDTGSLGGRHLREAPAEEPSQSAEGAPASSTAPAPVADAPARSDVADDFHNVILNSSIVSFAKKPAPVTDATTVVSSRDSLRLAIAGSESNPDRARRAEAASTVPDRRVTEGTVKAAGTLKAANNRGAAAGRAAGPAMSSEAKAESGVSKADSRGRSASPEASAETSAIYPRKRSLSPKLLAILIAAAAVLLLIVGFVLKRVDKAGEYKEYMTAATAKFESGDYDSCLTYLRKASSIDRDREVLVMMAECYTREGRYELAVEVLREISKPDEEIVQKISELEGLRASGKSGAVITLAGRTLDAGVTSLKLDGTVLTEEDLRQLAGLYSLTSLSLANTGLTDISVLSGLGGLTELNLSGNRISDLSPLASLTALRNLNLDNNPITDLSVLDGLSSLTSISISGVDISHEKLEALSVAHADCVIHTDSSGAASELTLGGSTFSVDSETVILTDLGIMDISALSQCKNLKYLDLSGNRITDLTPLMSIPGLETLVLSNNSISNLYPLMGITSLTCLHLENNSISSVTALTSLANLTELYLSGNHISTYAGLENLVRLETLDISSTNLTDETLLTLKDVYSLKLLNIQNNEGLTGNALDALKSNLNKCSVTSDKLPYMITVNGVDYTDNTVSLNLSGTNLDDIHPLKAFSSLETLNLSSNRISNLYSFEFFESKTTIKTLNLSNNMISDINGLPSLVNLESLDLSGNRITSVTPLGSLPKLQELNVSGCGLSETDLIWIGNALPNCRISY